MKRQYTVLSIAVLIASLGIATTTFMQPVQAKPMFCFDYINDSGEAGTACTDQGHKQCDNDADGSGYQITKKCYKQ